MLNGVNVNYIIVLLVTGAVLLAAIYHSILWLHRHTPLLLSYSVYLWASFFYCAFRSVFISSSTAFANWNPDEVLQMLAFAIYIHFASVALDLHPQKEKHAWRFTRITPFFVLAYLLLNTYLVNIQGADGVYLVAKILIRAYLLFIGLFLLLAVLKKRSSAFYRYLAAGAISMIFCGLVSTLVNLLAPDKFTITALSWLMFGFFSDVVFFSSAIGFRIREEHNSRELSLKQLMQKEAQLQQKELEKMKLAYETREEERLRIARDLHDDMGTTLSSINIYSNVVGSYMELDQKKAQEFLQKIQANTKQLMETTTDLIWSLQTNYGRSESIFSRMQKAGLELLSSANIAARIDIETQQLPLLNVAAQKACWLFFKEAINNVCKYSRANVCTVRVSAGSTTLTIAVADDGIGFNQPGNGNGLANMISRCKAFGGQCLIESVPGKGTNVTAKLPLAAIVSEIKPSPLHEETTPV